MSPVSTQDKKQITTGIHQEFYRKAFQWIMGIVAVAIIPSIYTMFRTAFAVQAISNKLTQISVRVDSRQTAVQQDVKELLVWKAYKDGQSAKPSIQLTR